MIMSHRSSRHSRYRCGVGQVVAVAAILATALLCSRCSAVEASEVLRKGNLVSPSINEKEQRINSTNVSSLAVEKGLITTSSDSFFAESNNDIVEKDQQQGPRRTQTIINNVKTFKIKLAFVLQYVNETSAEILEKGRAGNAMVHRLCSAVNLQSGGSQAQKSAAEDHLLVFTRSDYLFPRTGCRIIDTNRVFYPDTTPNIGLEILVSQEVSYTKLNDLTLNENATEISHAVDVAAVTYDRAYRHVSRGFSGGTGGRAKFLQLLKTEDGATGETISELQRLDNVLLLKRLSDPILMPTEAPTKAPVQDPSMTAPTVTLKPTNLPTKRNFPTETPSTPPSVTPTHRESSSSPSANGDASPILIPATSPPTTERPLAPGKGEAHSDGITQRVPTDDRNTPSATPDSSDSQQSILSIAAIAAASGALTGIFFVGLLSLYRYRKEQKLIPSVTADGTTRSRSRGSGSIPLHRPQQARPGLAGNGNFLIGARPPPIPVIVNDADGRSLAESTLGDRTAGRKPWAPSAPPVQFLNTAWVAGDTSMRKTDTGISIAASHISKISSLNSGTIGAGGSATVGEFSLEAAIKDEDDDSDTIQDGKGSTLSSIGVNSVSCSKEIDAIAVETSKGNSVSSLKSVDSSNITSKTPRASGAGARDSDTWSSTSKSENIIDDSETEDICYYPLPPTLMPERNKTANSLSPSEEAKSYHGLQEGNSTPRPRSPPSTAFSGANPLGNSTGNENEMQSSPKRIDDSDIARILNKSLIALKRTSSDTASIRNDSSTEPSTQSPSSSPSVTNDDNFSSPTAPQKVNAIKLPIDGTSDSSSSSNSGEPWLMDAVAASLGPRGKSADLESLSGRSNPSITSTRSAPVYMRSPTLKKNLRVRGSTRTSERSVGSKSRSSKHSYQSLGSLESRSIASDIKRLEQQLKILDNGEKGALRHALGLKLVSGPGATSSVGSIGSASSATSPRSKHSKTTARSRLEIRAPPGRLGIILANRSDADHGTVVSAVRSSSALAGKILPGDVLIAIDGKDVSKMHVAEVTAIMGTKCQHDKVLSIMTAVKQR